MPNKCTHPDHIDGVSCADRAVGCSKDCGCCIPSAKPIVDIRSVVRFDCEETSRGYESYRDMVANEFGDYVKVEDMIKFIENMGFRVFARETEWSDKFFIDENKKISYIGD